MQAFTAYKFCVSTEYKDLGSQLIVTYPFSENPTPIVMNLIYTYVFQLNSPTKNKDAISL